jgi:hypothetical protein
MVMEHALHPVDGKIRWEAKEARPPGFRTLASGGLLRDNALPLVHMLQEVPPKLFEQAPLEAQVSTCCSLLNWLDWLPLAAREFSA